MKIATDFFSLRHLLSLVTALLLCWMGNTPLMAQCAATVPTFVVDLTGAPDSTWLSPPTVRVDTCCGVTAPDRCVQFIVTLDTAANGIVMDIPEGNGCGARPTGSLFYQIGCGPQIPIGTPVCLNGPGPHTVTFCKPGNNNNCYQITSFAGPDASGDVVSQDGCSAQLFATGYDEATLVWNSAPFNPLHNSYLDCTIGCDTVTATYQAGAPPFVDYEVCGTPLGGCDTTPWCDTMRVYFVSTIGVTIQPDSPTVCFGAGTTDIYAMGIGGAAPYSFQWLDSGGSPLGNNDTLAVGPGTYVVEMTDTLNCTVVRDTVVVTAFALPIAALPGSDSTICGFDPIPLNGAVNAASGGVWHNGQGTFNPGPTDLNAIYLPSASEYAAGSVTLTLVTTGNGTCPADSDSVTFLLSPLPQPTPTGPNPVCEYTGGHTYSTPAQAGHSYAWTIAGGTLVSGQGTNSVDVFWNGAGTGTLTLTQTNPDGCDSTTTLSVTVNPKPDPIISGSPPFCEWSVGNPYAVLSVPGSSYLWTVSGGAIVAGQGTNAILVDWGSSGPATVQVTETNLFGCDTTVSISFAINPNPDPVISGPDTVCAWSMGQVYSSAFVPGDSYVWTVSGGTVASGQGSNQISVDWGAAGTGSVSLTQTNPAGCDTTVAISVAILPNPTSEIVGPDTVCQFDQGVGYSTSGAPGNTYQWAVTGGTLVSGQGTPGIVVDWGGTGNGLVTLTEVTPLGCDTSLQVQVFIAPKPSPSISGTPPFCEYATNIPYTTTLVPGNSYLWTVTGGTITSGQGTPSIEVSWGMAGNGTVTLTEANPLGCDTTVSVPIVIHPTPTPALSGPDSLCEFSMGQVYTTTANAGNTYLWSVTGGSIAGGQGTNSISVDWGVAGIGTVVVTETNSFGCDSSVALQVTLLPKPEPVIAGPDPVCEFSDGHAYSTALVPGNAYAWTVAGGTLASGQGTAGIVVNWGASGTGTLTLTETTPEGCDTTVTLTIAIHPKPNPVVSGVDSICAFSTGIPYQTPSVPGNTYLWTVTGGTISAGQNTNAISVDWGPAGSGTITVLETNNLGCDTTYSLAVDILPNPATFIDGPDSVCAYSGSIYNAQAVGGDSYNWTVSGGNIVNGQGSAVIEVVWGAPGPGSVSLVQTNGLGCDTSLVLAVEILSAPIPQLTGPASVCQYTGGHVYSTPPVPGVIYIWDAQGGEIESGQGTAAVEVLWDSSGTGILELYAVDPTGCDTTMQFPVEVLPAPIATINPADTFGCGFLEVPFNAGSSPNADFYAWTFGNGQSSNQASATIFYTNPGVFPVTLIASNANGCSDTANTHVWISPGPSAAFDYNPPSPVNIQLDSIEWQNNSLNGDFYFWDFGDGTLDSSFTPIHQYDTTGNLVIRLIVEDTLGCADTAYRDIELILDIRLFVPNAFTPNGDQLNDGFTVGYLNLRDFKVEIFSRWGELIYESNDPGFSWDGKHRGVPCQEGVFVWKISAMGENGSRLRRSGTVTLIR